jgi:hypothetical protein
MADISPNVALGLFTPIAGKGGVRKPKAQTLSYYAKSTIFRFPNTLLSPNLAIQVYPVLWNEKPAGCVDAVLAAQLGSTMKISGLNANYRHRTGW